MAKRTDRDKDTPSSVLDLILGREKDKESETREEKPRPPEPQASLETIGLTDCSVCGAECSVMLTKTLHPFTACGRCGGRTFYNSRVAIRMLKRHLRELKGD